MKRRADEPLRGAELATVLAALPGWTHHESGLAIYRDFSFRDATGAVLFVAFFTAIVRLNDFDLDFVFDLAGARVGVGLGAWSVEGITPRVALLASVADELAWLNRGER
jgi:hypothetical protein